MIRAARAATRIAALAERYWETFLEAAPSFATIVGQPGHDHRLEDPSPAGRTRARAGFEEIAVAARQIDPRQLGTADRITHSALLDEAEGELARLAAGLEDFTVDPIEGPQVQLLNLEAFQPAETPEQGRAMVERWRAIGPYLDTSIANLRFGLASGRVGVRSPVEKAIESLLEIERLGSAGSPLLRPLAKDRSTWPTAAREAFATDLTAAVEEIVLPAFARYRSVLEAEILPAARPDDRPGILHLPDGEAAYRALIRYHTTLDLDPVAIHETGLREVERTDRELADLGGRTLGRTDLRAIQATLRTAPALHFTSRDEVLRTAVDSLRRAEAASATWFRRLPRAACEVVEIPEHEARHSTVAYYVWPTVDGRRPGRYYLNTSDPTSRPRYDAETLAFHEAVPGHHLQIALAQELDDLPAFRRMLGPTVYSEGWALYAEHLADEMGLFSSDLDRIGRVSSQAWRAARLVVDTGMHAFRWSRDQAIRFLAGHTVLAENNVVNEVDRYIVWPGQALAYLPGQLEILRLRGVAQVALGDRFAIADFHDAILGHGAVSLGTLAELVDLYVAAREAA